MHRFFVVQLPFNGILCAPIAKIQRPRGLSKEQNVEVIEYTHKVDDSGDIIDSGDIVINWSEEVIRLNNWSQKLASLSIVND